MVISNLKNETIITVFTPTYNRAHCLRRCYESLKKQKNKQFQWLIIDDGSTDGTEALVKQWQLEDNNFSILYYWKENGGKYTAYNKAVELIDTELWICIDSDDWLEDNAIETILSFWNKNGKIVEQTDKKIRYAGIVGLDADKNGQLLGGLLPDCNHLHLWELQAIYHYPADFKVVYDTAITKRYYPVKEIPGEKEFDPIITMLEIDQAYPLLVLNEVLCRVDYQEDGISQHLWERYQYNPVSFTMLRVLYINSYIYKKKLPKLFYYRQMIHYISSAVFAAEQKKEIPKVKKGICYWLAFFPGILLNLYIRIRVYKQKKQTI